MRFQIASKWSLTQQFEITDSGGNPAFDVRHAGLGQQLSLCDQSGQELALIHKHFMSLQFEVVMNGSPVAEIRHKGIFGERYEIDSSAGPIAAQGSFAGRSYEISRAGQVAATVSTQFSLREKFAVDVTDGEDVVFMLAIVLAIEAIHHDRESN